MKKLLPPLRSLIFWMLYGVSRLIQILCIAAFILIAFALLGDSEAETVLIAQCGIFLTISMFILLFFWYILRAIARAEGPDSTKHTQVAKVFPFPT